LYDLYLESQNNYQDTTDLNFPPKTSWILASLNLTNANQVNGTDFYAGTTIPINGKVFNRITLEPKPNFNVSIIANGKLYTKLKNTTDSEGNFKINFPISPTIENNTQIEIWGYVLDTLPGDIEYLNHYEVSALDHPPIYISDNWSEVKAAGLCSGAGTEINPYIIENIIINAHQTGSCVEIINSNENFVIRNCTFINSERTFNEGGIRLYSVENGIIKGNILANNSYNGIFGEYCQNIIIENNIFDSNEELAILLRQYNYYNIIVNNSFYNFDEPVGSLISVSIQEYSENNTVVNNTLYFGGIQTTSYSMNNIVENNTLIEGSLWIDGEYNEAYLNFLKKGNVYLEGFYNEIFDNYINSSEYGIEIWFGSFNLIYDNIITNHHYGIYLHYVAKWNQIFRNNISFNDYGIFIWTESFGNIFTDNTIYQNTYGVELHSHNLFYENIFENLEKNAIDETGGNLNNWNNSIIGNYWNDYKGLDANDDGIGDSAYSIKNITDNVVSHDFYPMWSTIPIIIIYSPVNNSIINSEPLLNITALDTTLEYIWYTINGEREFLLSGQAEYLRTSIWLSLNEGINCIYFYANDSIGNIRRTSINIVKDTIKPILNLWFPINHSIFGSKAPQYNLSIYDLNLEKAWYTINANNTKYYFIPQNGYNLIDLNHTIWDSIPNNSNVTVYFFVEDRAGNIVNVTTKIYKQGVNQNYIPGYTLFLFWAILIVVALIYYKKEKKS